VKIAVSPAGASAPREAAPDVVDHGRDGVTAALLREGPATAAVLASRLGISTTAVRRHLDALEVEGLVESSPRPPYGPTPRRGRGRPARVFTLTAAGRQTFPDTYDQLAVSAVEFLLERLGPDAVNAFAQARAEQLAADLRSRLGDPVAADTEAPVCEEERLVAVAGALTELGFAASVAPAPTGLQLCQHHCPVAHVAERFPQLCEAETEALAGVLGHHVQRLATMAHGDAVCTTVIPLARPATSPASLIDPPTHATSDERTSA
jgi:predicted ArsR family transcriptional regulator